MSKWIIFLLVVLRFYAQQTDINLFLKNVAKYNLSIQENYSEYKQQASKYYRNILPEHPKLSFEWNEIGVGNPINSANEKNISLNQTFEFPLNYYYKLEKADLSEQIAYQIYLEKSFKVLLSAKKEAFRYFILRKKKTLINDFIERYTVVLKHMKKMNEAGEISEVDVLRISIEYEQLLNEQREFEREIFSQKERLRSFLPQFDSHFFIVNEIDSNLNQVVLKKELWNKSPRLLISKLEQEKANRHNILSYLQRLPNLSFTYKRQEINQIKYNGFEFAVSIPLWVPKEIEYVEESQLIRKSAFIRLKSRELFLEQFFKSAWKKYQISLSNWRRFKYSLLPKSEKIFLIAQKRYQAGEISYIAFIDTYQVWKNVRFSELSQHLSLLISIADLQQIELLNYLKKRADK